MMMDRMMAQTCRKGLRKYTSTWSALYTIANEEYSQNPLGLWLTPNLLIPSLLQHSIQPFLEFIAPVLTDRLLRGHKAGSWSVIALDLAISTIELVIMIPIETVRKRLQCQAIRNTPIQGNLFKFSMSFIPDY